MNGKLCLIAACLAFSAAAVSAGTLLPIDPPGTSGGAEDEYCMGTPMLASPSQCDCPGCPDENPANCVAADDFCVAVLPMYLVPPYSSNETTGYYCMSMPDYECTPGGLSCGGEVWRCEGAHCLSYFDPIDECEETGKEDFCQGTFPGCTDDMEGYP